MPEINKCHFYDTNLPRMKRIIGFIATLLMVMACEAQPGLLVFQSDFGLKDGAVSAMKGVALKVSANLKLYDITHEIPAFNIWEAAYRLEQTAPYWPAGTVFVSVVDPGVGSTRRSIVAKTKTGQFIVTPDNGTLTLFAGSMGIEAVRVINEKLNRLPGSGASNTFHGRDVFAYTGARLASHTISFEQVGPLLREDIVIIPYQRAAKTGTAINGNLPVLDVQYGNVWTNIPEQLLKTAGVRYGDSLLIQIRENGAVRWNDTLPFVKTFSSVDEGRPLVYINSLLNLALAIN